MSDDWTEYDAINVLALPLHRWTNRQHYRIPGGWSGDLREVVYSNGTEHGFATETAETVLELGPWLRRVLLAGVKALDGDPRFENYRGALAAGDHEAIVASEKTAAEVPA